MAHETGFRPAGALRAALAAGYGPADFRADVLAGLIVGIVALPLSMALAIASGMPPQNGLYTASVAGIIAAVCGGSRVQITGPTAAFVVVLLPIVSMYGPAGLLTASLMAGVLLVIGSLLGIGRFVQLMPSPVTTGFTAGIAIVLALLQVQDFLGLHVAGHEHGFFSRVGALWAALPTVQRGDTLIGVLTLAVLLISPRVLRRIPAHLVALLVGTGAALLLRTLGTTFEAETIASRFTHLVDGVEHAGIPQGLPEFKAPWAWPAADGGTFELSFELIRALMPAAVAIAALGAIESLLSAVVGDGMSGNEHHPDTELLGQGVANFVAPFFGGFAATGAVARTATNVRAGARSPIAAIVHGLFVLAVMLLLAPLLGYLPMASLAALLLVVAWNMSHIRHAIRIVRRGQRHDGAILITCLVLTVVFDMVVAIAVGVVLACVLFMRRMIEMTGTTAVESSEESRYGPIPDGVSVYHVAGPLFFGAAHKAMGALGRTDTSVHTVILDLHDVPFIDETGMMSLASAVSRIQRNGAQVVLAGLCERTAEAIARAGFEAAGEVHVEATVETALAAVRPPAPG